MNANKIEVIDDIANRLLMNGRVKNMTLAKEIARKWVTVK